MGKIQPRRDAKYDAGKTKTPGYTRLKHRTPLFFKLVSSFLLVASEPKETLPRLDLRCRP